MPLIISRSVATLLFAAVLLFAISLPAQEKTFAWKFKQDEKYSVTTTQVVRQTVDVGVVKIEIPVTMVLRSDWMVEKVNPDNAAQIALTFRRVTIDMKGPQPLSYDSDKGDAGNPLAEGFNAIIGKKLQGKMSAAGKMSDIVIPETLKEELRKSPQFAGGSDEALEQLISAGFSTFPAKAIKVGESWKESSEASIAGFSAAITTKVTYTGEETRGNQKLDKFVTTMSFTPNENANLNGVPIRVPNQKTAGTFLFDSVAGKPVEITSNQSMTLELGEVGSGQKVDMKIDQKVEFKKAE